MPYCLPTKKSSTHIWPTLPLARTWKQLVEGSVTVTFVAIRVQALVKGYTPSERPL